MPTELAERLRPARMAELTLASAVREGLALRSVAKGDLLLARQLMLAVLTSADQLAGGRLTEAELAVMAKEAASDFTNFSIEFLLLAIKAGVKRDKVFGKIAYSQVAGWVADAVNHVLEENNDRHRARG